MKLVFYDDMPSTPNAPERSSTRMSEWPTVMGGSSRPSSMKSQSVLRKRRTTILGRRPPQRTISPVQRIPAFRPLQLSIYLPDNRLSDLPEFNLAEFTSVGEIKLPPKAVTRAKSEANLPQITSDSSPRKAKSMVDWRPRVEAEGADPVPQLPGYPAQRSSVTWDSLPGIAPANKELVMSGALIPARTSSMMAITTTQRPLQNSMSLTFPPVDREYSGASEAAAALGQRPSVDDFPRPPVAVTPPKAAVTAQSLSRQPTPNTRVSQWLERSNTSSTISSISTTPRRGRKGPPSKLSISAPIPIQPPEHIRTTTISSLTSSQDAASNVASVHMALTSPHHPAHHERTITMTSLTPSNAPSQQGPKHSRNRTTSSSTIASTALSSLLNNAEVASLSSYTTMTTSPPPTSLRGNKAALMPALPVIPNTAPATQVIDMAATAPPTEAPARFIHPAHLATIKDDSVIMIAPVASSDVDETVERSKPQQPAALLTTLPQSKAQEDHIPSPAVSTSSDSTGPITPPRQRMLAQQAANPALTHRTGKGSSGSHWGYLPKQYAEVWKRETVVSERDVGVAF